MAIMIGARGGMLGLAVVAALVFSPAKADAEYTTGTVLGLVYGGSSVAGVVTAAGSGFALQSESVTAQRTWGIASAVTGTIDSGWSAALLYTGGLHCGGSSLGCSVNDVATIGGTLSLFIALPNLLMSVTALLRADGLKPFKESRVSFSPITMSTMQGPIAHGVSVSGAF